MGLCYRFAGRSEGQEQSSQRIPKLTSQSVSLPGHSPTLRRSAKSGSKPEQDGGNRAERNKGSQIGGKAEQSQGTPESKQPLKNIHILLHIYTQTYIHIHIY